MNGGGPSSLERILGRATLEQAPKYIHLADVHVWVQRRWHSPMDVMQAALRQRSPLR